MKLSNTIKHAALSLLLFFLFHFSPLRSQTELTVDGQFHTISYTGTYQDFTVPENFSGKLILELHGGDGGFAQAQLNGNCEGAGGQGTTITQEVLIGTGTNEIPPGSTIRFIVGEAGESHGTNGGIVFGFREGGGGGGTGVAAQINGSWKIISVAGGGGGGYADVAVGICDTESSGQPGNTSTSGTSGRGGGAASGGSNGQGGDSNYDGSDGNRRGAGGGLYSDGEGANYLGFYSGGTEGWENGPNNGSPTGGAGGVLTYGQNGGFGFGGGGASDNGAGGGGGYSGGGTGANGRGGGSGGSYVHPDYSFSSEIPEAGTTMDSQDGYVMYKLACTGEITVSGFGYVNPLCLPDDLGRIQFAYATDICESALEWSLSPVNGWSYLGDGIFRSVRAGNYSLTVENTHTDEIVATYSFTVSQGNIAPEPECQNITIYLDDGNYSNENLHNLIDNGSTSICDEPLTLSASATSFDCDDLGDNTVTLTVTGHNGVSATCNSTVTVALREEEPVARCISTFSVDLASIGAEEYELKISDVNNGSNIDGCTTGITLNPSRLTCADIGSNTVTLTITNGASSATCTTVVLLSDSNDPTASCFGMATIALDDSGTATLTTADIDNGSTSNNCTDLTYALSQTNFDCNDLGTNNVVLTVTDGYGKGDNCSTTLTVQDGPLPTATCADISIYLDEDGEYNLDPYEIYSADFNCSGVLSASKTVFDCNDLGIEQEITLTVSDAENNVSSCVSRVLALDTIAPVSYCLSISVNITSFVDLSTTYGNQIRSSGLDNCGELSVAFIDSPIMDCDDEGVNEVRVEFADPSGNKDTCAVVVTVSIRDRAPVALCSDITVELDDSGSYTLDDEDVQDLLTTSRIDCETLESLNATASPSTFDCNDLDSEVAVTMTLTKAGYDPSVCTSMVTVVAPEVECQTILPVELAAFSARLIKNAEVQLNWQTMSEVNNAGFEIEHSVDQYNWEVLDFVAGQGSSLEISHYQYVHQDALQGDNYYRLKQVDFDGGYTSSEIKWVKVASTLEQFVTYPNPTAGIVTLYFPAVNQRSELMLIDRSGRVLKTVSIAETTGQHRLQLANYPAGVYTVILRRENSYLSRKIVLKHQ